MQPVDNKHGQFRERSHVPGLPPKKPDSMKLSTSARVKSRPTDEDQ
jgi:hypothetical protein